MRDEAQNEYARLAAKYDERWAFYVGATMRETMARLSPGPADTLLDVGCGSGVLLEAVCAAFPGVVAKGVDPSPEMLDVARRKLPGRVELTEGRAEDLPFPDASFDLVVSCSSLRFWQKPLQAMGEIARVLKPTGRVVVTAWCHDYLTCRLCDLFLGVFSRHHFPAYGSDECRAMLAEAGFTGVRVERYKLNWLWGMMTAQAGRPDREETV